MDDSTTAYKIKKFITIITFPQWTNKKQVENFTDVI